MTIVKNADHPMLTAHAEGHGLRAIGRQQGVSHETARKRIVEDGTALIRSLSRDLLLAEAAEYQGLEPVVWPGIEIPFQPQEEWMAAIDLFSWCCRKLTGRGFDLAIQTRQTTGGTVFVLRTVPSRPPRRNP